MDALTPRQKEILAAYEEHGSERKAAKALGCHYMTVHQSLVRIRKKLARLPDDAPSVTVEAKDDEVSVTARGRRILTLAQLLAAAEVDRREWRVREWTANAWETVIDGAPATLHQVKARLERVPEWILRPVQPVAPLPRQPSSAAATDVQHCLVVPDSQNGYRFDARTGTYDPLHDRAAWDCVVSLAQEIRPDVIVLLGDMLDLAAFSSKFPRPPELRYVTQPALLELHWWLSQLRLAVPAARIVYLEGNHEARLARLVCDSVSEASNLRPVDRLDGPTALSVPALLALEALDVEYVGPYPADWWLWGVRFTHGTKVGARGGATAAKLLGDATCSTVQGHVHRVEMGLRTLWGPDGHRPIFALSPGCLCRVGGVVPGKSPREDWQQGFALLSRYGDGRILPRVGVIEDGRTLFRGRVHQGRDRREEIAAAVGWPL